MSVNPDTEPEPPEDPAGPARAGERATYEPPAMAWEESFETLAAATCAHYTDVDCPGPGFPTQ